MVYLDCQIRKTDLEIKILSNDLEVGAWPQVNCVNYWDNTKASFLLLVFVGNKEDRIKCEQFVFIPPALACDGALICEAIVTCLRRLYRQRPH